MENYYILLLIIPILLMALLIYRANPRFVVYTIGDKVLILPPKKDEEHLRERKLFTRKEGVIQDIRSQSGYGELYKVCFLNGKTFWFDIEELMPL